MIPEKEFKKRLIYRLNSKSEGWRDGDLDSSVGRKADVVNDALKIAVEIKDDTTFHFIHPDPGQIVTQTTNLSTKNRQLKNHIKDANEKFLNYPDYKTVVLIRTEMLTGTIDYTIDGPQTFGKIGGQLVYTGRPSTFWGHHDKSTSEVGGILFWGDKCQYRINENPNTKPQRILLADELSSLIGESLINESD
ncbi:MAG: hypothetical protein KBC02_03050 [Candidatus Pacebacteria bacterium]|nr:hypothetical protein [Candidatus Paceibacterota bacterium]